MQRAATALLGFAVVVLAVWMVVRNYQPPKPVGGQSSEVSPAASAPGSPGGGAEPARATAVDAGLAGADDAGPLLLSDLVVNEPDRRVDGGVGSVMPGGGAVPLLPLNGPRQVRFGVVLVSYAGAQPSIGGGGRATRSRAEAQALAAKLLVTAQTDFHAAVQQGDAGSADDLGRVKLGVLEPAPEYVLFTLNVDGVGGPVDTPRGYSIVKRLE